MQFKKEAFINTFSLALFLLSIFILLFFPKTITFASTTAGCGEYWGGNWTIPANTYCGVLNEVIAVSKHLVLQPGSTLELNGTTNLIFGFKYRIPITINNTGNSNTLNAWPVLINLSTNNLISAGKMRSDCGDIRFGDADLNGYAYWIESGCNSASTLIWVNITSIPASNNKVIYVFYGNPSATSISNPREVFLVNSIYLETRDCSDSTNCGYTDNHAEFDTLRTTGRTLHGSGYRNAIDDAWDPWNTTSDYYWSRYRFLFIANETTTYCFGTNSDDASEVPIYPCDGYGSEHSCGAHDVVSYWYGTHASGTCGSSGTIGCRSLSNGQGVWIDYAQSEWTGGQLSQMCINTTTGFPWKVVNETNFPLRLYARKYTKPEPNAIIGTEESNLPQYIYIYSGGKLYIYPPAGINKP